MNSAYFSNVQLQTIFESGHTHDPLDEIVLLASLISPQLDEAVITKIHQDMGTIFKGSYPGFRASQTKYHNLRHTYSVVLATIRLFDGLHLEKTTISPDLILQGLLSAYFHDTGMLLQTTDGANSGANYTRYHEQRSIAILEKYLQDHSMPQHFISNCSTMIKWTNLDHNINPSEVDDRELSICCQVLASADLLAQMADRYYIESLPLLFQEHKEGGIDEHSSALHFMQGTIDFHQKIFLTRLKKTLGDISPVMRTHFKGRWGIDQDLYQDNIDLNIGYLKKITEDCSLDLQCWEKYLRRRPPGNAGKVN